MTQVFTSVILFPPMVAQMLTVISVNTRGSLSLQPVMIELISLLAHCEKQKTIFYLTNLTVNEFPLTRTSKVIAESDKRMLSYFKKLSQIVYFQITAAVKHPHFFEVLVIECALLF